MKGALLSVRTGSSLVAAITVITAHLALTPATAQEPSPSAPPESGIEEIVVRGESEGAEDFVNSDSVTDFSAADIQALGAQSIEDLASFTPNLEIVTTGATTPTFFIRGVGLNDFNPNGTSAVAVYQDDVNLNAGGLQLGTLFDIDTVNVLRGPQGTGLARNASAGAIKLYTRKPTGQLNGYLRGSAGNYRFRDYEGAVEAPLYGDLLSARVAFRLSERDGFVDNRCGGLPVERISTLEPYVGLPVATCKTSFDTTPRFGLGDLAVPPGLPTEVNDLDNWAVRGTVRFEPTLAMSWLAGAQFARRDEFSRLGQAYGVGGFLGSQDAGFPQPYKKPEVAMAQYRSFLKLRAACEAAGCSLSPNASELVLPASLLYAPFLAKELDDEPFRGYYSRVGPTQNDVWNAYLQGEILLPYRMELRTVTGYAAYDRLIDVDLDFSPSVLAQIVTDDEVYQLTEDVSLIGDLGAWDPATWGLGGFFLYEDLDVTTMNMLSPNIAELAVAERDYSQQIRSFGVYGEFERDFREDFTLDGGVRWNWENKAIRERIVNGPRRRALTFFEDDTTWQSPTGTLRLTYRFREDTHAFWKYTRGWKAGHYNATSSARGATIGSAEPEAIDAFETGLVASWLGGRIDMDLSLFYYAYTDYQIFTIENNFGSPPAFVVLNAENAEIYGAELDLVGKPWAGAFWNARASWLESQFLDFVQLQVIQDFVDGRPVTLIREVDSKGNRLLNSPQFKVSLTVEQAIPLGGYGTLIPRYDGVWTDDTFFDATEGRGVPDTAGSFVLPEHTLGQRAFFLHNARLSYAAPAGSPVISLWVRNIEDTVYRQFAADATNFLETSLHFLGDPRTYGIDVIFHF